VIHNNMRLTTQFTRVRRAAEKDGEKPPDIGQVSELIRNTLTQEYNIFPPNLSTEISPDGSIKLLAVNPDTGLNIQVNIQNLAGDLVHPEGQLTGVVPPAPGGMEAGGGMGQAGAPAAPGGNPAAPV
jgi:hypothetical protein